MKFRSYFLLIIIISLLFLAKSKNMKGNEDLSYQVNPGDKRSYILEDSTRNTGLEEEVRYIITDKMGDLHLVLPGSNVTVEITELDQDSNIKVLESWNTTDNKRIETQPFYNNGSCITGFLTKNNCKPFPFNETGILKPHFSDWNDWYWIIPSIDDKSYWENYVDMTRLLDENHTINFTFEGDKLFRNERIINYVPQQEDIDNESTTIYNSTFEEYILKKYNWKTGWLIYYNFTRMFYDFYGNWTSNFKFILSSIDDQNDVSQVIGFELFHLTTSFGLIIIIIQMRKTRKIKK